MGVFTHVFEELIFKKKNIIKTPKHPETSVFTGISEETTSSVKKIIRSKKRNRPKTITTFL